MKTFKYITLTGFLLWATPLLMIVPNVCLAFTEQWSLMAKLAGIFLPAGLYFLLVSCSRKVGRTVLWCIPLMIYCAFQIVLIYLYGESIIAIDMIMNVFTTNPGEVAELLGNLVVAILTVVILYLPPIVFAIVAVCRKKTATASQLRIPRMASYELIALGVFLLTLCYIKVPGYRIERQLFPVNVIYNTGAAVNRTRFIARYHDTSAEFTYHARSVRPDTVPEVYVMIVGETSRADNWQLAGYNRPTNPRLSLRDDIMFFSHALSESNTTHKSVPMILSYLDSETFGDSIYNTKGIFTAFREAGFSTAFLSNQRRNRSFIEFFGDEADVVEYVSDTSGPQLDGALLPRLQSLLNGHTHGKLMVVLHTYGSHFNYKERYEADDEYFTPASQSEATIENRDQLINAYDNTIRYTDAFVDSVISTVEALDCPAAVLYLSDHGEDIFDDSRHRFLHASPTPTFTQLHVPLLIWTSPRHRELYASLTDQARKHMNAEVSSTASAFPTMLQLAGVDSPFLDRTHALTDSIYRKAPRSYVTDHNESVPLNKSGLRAPDFTAFEASGISVE